MKKVKIAFWLIVFGFVALVIFQNQDFFLAERSLSVNLFFAKYETPLMPNAVLFVAFFLTGLLISYFLSLVDKFKSGKIIKELRAVKNSQVETIDALKKELDASKGLATAPIAGEGVADIDNQTKQANA